MIPAKKRDYLKTVVIPKKNNASIYRRVGIIQTTYIFKKAKGTRDKGLKGKGNGTRAKFQGVRGEGQGQMNKEETSRKKGNQKHVGDYRLLSPHILIP